MSKLLYEMTRAEYMINLGNWKSFDNGILIRNKEIPKIQDQNRIEEHKIAIRQAIEAGKVIPKEVLSDYPDIEEEIVLKEIESTHILPYILADQVIRELFYFFYENEINNTLLPEEEGNDHPYAEKLVSKLISIWQNNAIFKKRFLKSKDQRGYLAMFFRHWLCGFVPKELQRFIPQEFKFGGAIPENTYKLKKN